MLALLLTFITGTAFSNNTDAINRKVLTTFTKTFANAEDVQWEVKKDLFKATFKLQGQTIFAYFNIHGEQVALSRNISVYQLPLNLATQLQKGYNQYWLTQLFEVSTANENAYYAVVESVNYITTYKANGTNSWTVFKKEKK